MIYKKTDKLDRNVELKDEIKIPATVNDIYCALNDELILQKCIPGCEDLVRISINELEIKVAVKLGVIKLKLLGRVVLNNHGAPETFLLIGEGKGRLTKMSRGWVRVNLKPYDQGTILSYTSKVQFGEKVTKLGDQVIIRLVKKLSKKFFTDLAKIVSK
ncbi:MAG: carbon monoxide dehydrogenase [Rhodobacteraceae bacterium]|nr:carbon monoxide dehydrogenase [Paracoccaceae bacterium]